MINIEMALPEFSKMILKVTTEYKTKPRVIFSHHAFNDKENKLMGSAIKYCALRNVGVIVLGQKPPDINETSDYTKYVKDMKVMTNVQPEIELDSEEYSVYDVEALGKKVKKLAQKHESIIIPSKYFRICQVCGGSLEEDIKRPEEESKYFWGLDEKKEEYSVALDEKLNRK